MFQIRIQFFVLGGFSKFHIPGLWIFRSLKQVIVINLLSLLKLYKFLIILEFCVTKAVFFDSLIN